VAELSIRFPPLNEEHGIGLTARCIKYTLLIRRRSVKEQAVLPSRRELHLMLQTCKTVQEFMLQPRAPINFPET
jgi:hypothetical protein